MMRLELSNYVTSDNSLKFGGLILGTNLVNEEEALKEALQF